MILECVAAGPLQTNAYLIGCEKEKVGCIIDPAPGSADKLCSLIEKHGLKIQAIYLTHSHLDHFADCALLKKKFNWPIFVHKDDAENLHKPGSDGIPNIWGVESVQEDGYLEEGQVLKVGSLEFKVIYTPGHSPGGLCFYFEKEKVLIAGDVLFKGSHGNVSFPSSDEDKMVQSLKRLMELPDDVRVFPGHFESTTIGEERSWICH